MPIALLHTADIHVATFDRIFADLDANVQLDHHVDASLLEKARESGAEAVRDEVTSRLEGLSNGADVVLCTCSTLGPLVDDAAQSLKNIVRIDRPLMAQACADGAKILVALCLDSTREATLDLLQQCAANAGQQITPVVVLCADAWADFEVGDMEAFAISIADAIKAKIIEEPDVESIILAQASMRVAASRLEETGLPVRSSPVLAAQHCLDILRTIEASET